MKNRLEYIQKLLNEGVYSPGGDVAWLVAEVERLRGELRLEDYNAEVEGPTGDVERLMAEVRWLRDKNTELKQELAGRGNND